MFTFIAEPAATQHVCISAQLVFQPDSECPPDISSQTLSSNEEDKRGEHNGFIYAERRIPLETSILSGRLNIVQTDRQKGIIPPLPSPPLLPSKPSGSHFSVTTEEEDQRGKGAPLCSSLIIL